ncbi:MAG: GLPGLI family protein [Porphyromonas sp.]|nr:GLPGLI family protein [Porphyromonas sp.]
MRYCIFILASIVLSLVELRAQANLSGLDNRLDSVRKIVLAPIKYEVSYEYSYRRDALDTFDVRREPMLLQLSDSHLRFVSVNLYAADTLQDNAYHRGVQSFMEIMAPWRRYRSLARYDEQLTCDLGTKSLHANVPIVLDNWYYTEEMPRQEWTLLEGDSVIMGYVCHRASTSFRGRSYVAYYAPDIPLPYGPWKFGGLPGLILSVADEGGNHTYTAVGLEEVKAYRPLYRPVLNREKKSSRKEVLGMQANYAKNPSMVLGNIPGVRIDPKDLAELKPRPHNPQELE